MSNDVPNTWRRLGGGTENPTTDNYGWAYYLKDSTLPQLLCYEDQVHSMPFGHHQLCIFIEGGNK
jgi:hypothetical protein